MRFRLIFSTVSAVLVLFALEVHALGRQAIPGHVPSAAARAQAVGRLGITNHLQLAIGLPLRNRPAFTNLLNQLYNPASPNYRRYLTPEQFAEQFGPTEQDYQAAIAFARAHGLRVTSTHPNRMILDVTGSVADVEKTFQVKLHVYPHPQETRTFFAPDGEPSLDLQVPVLHIGGLNNYSRPRPRSQRVPFPRPCRQPSTPPH